GVRCGLAPREGVRGCVRQWRSREGRVRGRRAADDPRAGDDAHCVLVFAVDVARSGFGTDRGRTENARDRVRPAALKPPPALRSEAIPRWLRPTATISEEKDDPRPHRSNGCAWAHSSP